MVPQVELFSFVFWEIWRRQKDISKLTDLYETKNAFSVLFFKKLKLIYFSCFFKVADGEMALPTFCTWMEAIPHGAFWITCHTVVRFVWVSSIRGLWPRQPSEKSIWSGLMPCPEFVKLHTARRPCFPDRNNGHVLLVVVQFLVKLEKRRQASPKMLFNHENANCQKPRNQSNG